MGGDGGGRQHLVGVAEADDGARAGPHEAARRGARRRRAAQPVALEELDAPSQETAGGVDAVDGQAGAVEGRARRELDWEPVRSKTAPMRIGGGDALADGVGLGAAPPQAAATTTIEVATVAAAIARRVVLLLKRVLSTTTEPTHGSAERTRVHPEHPRDSRAGP